MTEKLGISTPQGTLAAERWAGRDPALAPVVLFHDSLGSISLWRGFPAALAEATGRGVVAYDRLGFGGSEPRSGPLPADFIAAEATGGFVALRQALGLGPFVALGHSVGGAMALHVAAAFPQDAAAVVSISAQHHNDDRIRAGIAAARDDFARPGRLDRLARHHGDKADWVLESWIGSWIGDRLDEWSVAPARAALRCPVLAIHGTADEYGTPDHASAIAGPDGRLALLPGLGHFPHREDESTVVTLVADFLRELRPRDLVQTPALH